MKLAVISPESDEPREHAVLAALCEAGLERYQVRKPSWSREKLAAWLAEVPARHRARLVLHQHHALAVEFSCGGVHFKANDETQPPAVAGLFTSRSCHTLAELSDALGRYDSVFFSPVFPSISKVGYQPQVDQAELTAMLHARTEAQRRTTVIALGGVTPENCACCAELGFDGVAVLGALWQSAAPLDVFHQLKRALTVSGERGMRLGGDASPYPRRTYVA